MNCWTCGLCGSELKPHAEAYKMAKPGAPALCFNCGAIGIIKDNGDIRIATAEEVDSFMRHKMGSILRKAQRRTREELFSYAFHVPGFDDVDLLDRVDLTKFRVKQ